MLNARWAEIDIEAELILLETLLSASTYMNLDDENEQGIAMDLIGMSLSRVRELKAAGEVNHA